ncbi:ribosomal L7Ae/L30e/S12e/Gadd45 family protein [Herbivorax sp. ANBcel31]|uniref:L7Ae/L30e/S12e/Gadd45 family ribosomal protein n=1 Tax=Herbivorax sp. ANBcel31 TaxID=3069754 RepID=UPI0027B5AA32|nr:ribosomal L7Ae/L30e/S12e/Gadd45 family protein [Herbivorax sp. ANBcel31]MDQ2086897.1 ribosomal L7Ae/L30e/S12e/Gadd45 family protein [Herbivorax sp. ANBcel31]
MANRVYSFLGMAKKANKLTSGDETCEKLLKAGKVKLIVVARDASFNTKKKYNDACLHKSVDMRIFGAKELLGKFIGKGINSVVAILDKGFSNNLIRMIDDENNACGGEDIDKKKSL